MAAGAHPYLGRRLELEVAQPLGRHQPAVGDAAREARLLGPEQDPAHPRVDAVGAHDDVEVGGGPVGEARLDALPALAQIGQPVTEVQALGGQRIRQRPQQVGAVHLVVREAELRLQRLRQRRAQERAAVVPAPLMPGQRTHAGARQRVGETEPVQDARGVRADLDAGADLAQRRRLLVDVHVQARAQQRERRREAADASADDADSSSEAHVSSDVAGARRIPD